MISPHLLPTEKYQGPLNAGFRFADGESFAGVALMAHRAMQSALGEAERHRLVEAAKSPTRSKADELARAFYANRDPMRWPPVAAPLAQQAEGPCSVWGDRAAVEARAEAARVAPAHAPGLSTLLEYRQWCDEYRVRTATNGAVNRGAPPPQAGDRYTAMLTDRGARAIADSCAYVAKVRGGYKTFATGTLSPEARAAIARRNVEPKPNDITAIPGREHVRVGFDDGVFRPVAYVWESSVQREVSRTMDALQKMYQRGWQTEAGEWVPPVRPCRAVKAGREKKAGVTLGDCVTAGPCSPVRIEGEPLAYCWVVEVPKNAEGEDNPHVHLLMDWAVEYRHFREWSQRIESLWGNGYFHLEKIDDPNAAGAYMAKAAGYLTKAAGQDDQGAVRGNRYGISACARAPGWAVLEAFEYGQMAALIAEMAEALAHKYGADYAQRRQLAAEREAVRIKAKAEQAASGGKYPLWAKQQREQIGAKLAAVRARIDAIPARANKYQIVLKGGTALSRFLGWCRGAGWQAGERLPSHAIESRRRLSLERRRWRKAWQESDLCGWIERQSERVSDSLALPAWLQWEQFAAQAA